MYQYQCHMPRPVSNIKVAKKAFQKQRFLLTVDFLHFTRFILPPHPGEAIKSALLKHYISTNSLTGRCYCRGVRACVHPYTVHSQNTYIRIVCTSWSRSVANSKIRDLTYFLWLPIIKEQTNSDAYLATCTYLPTDWPPDLAPFQMNDRLTYPHTHLPFIQQPDIHVPCL